MSATVRVFVPTFRRPRLLERALVSLRTQTMPDWIAEVHNDAPEDDAPAAIVARFGDGRIEFHRHERNLGGTATFNLFFRATAEPFRAMLEDDNAWQPDFLATMLSVADQHPDASVFWSNQRIWEEQPDGTVRDTGRLARPAAADPAPRRIAWGRTEQIFGALHAHSAALFRSHGGDNFRTPDVPIVLVEAFRERLFPHPLVFVPQPLADFTRTLRTARSDDRVEWTILQTMLAATFLKHARLDERQLAAVWREAGSRRPPATSTLLLATMVEPACRPLRRHARTADWVRLVRGLVRRPWLLPRVRRSRARHADWWNFLDHATAVRFAEQRAAAR